MSLETVQLRRYIDHFSQYDPNLPFLSVKEKIEKGQPHLFDFEYPFFDESKRKEFERKWIRRFYMNDIGFETIGLFKFYLENWMNEKMPYYNQRFQSELIQYDPLKNTITEKHQDHSKDGTRNDDVNSTEDTINKKNGSFHIDTKDNGEFETNTVQDGTSNTEGVGNSTSDGTSNTTGSKTLEDIGSRKGNKDNKGTSKEFERKVESDTPDGRLAITTEDGSGVLEYASKIGEDVNNSETTSRDDYDESTKKNGLENSDTDTVNHNESTSTIKSDTKTKDVGNTTGTTENVGVQDGTTTEDQKGNKTGNVNLDQKTGEIGNQNEFFEGKIGVETYQEMIMKYRETFIRIESEIYEECRKDLFLLVY